MGKEKEKLLNMLNEQKISEHEFKLLSSALDKKESYIASLFSLAINPFQKVAGSYALFIGLIIMLLMSYLGVIAKVYFPGILDCLNSVVVKNPKIPLNFFLLLYQNVVCWLVLSILFMIAPKIFQKKGTRVIDFFGMVSLSRFPYLMLTVFLCIVQIVNPNFMNIDLSKGIQYHLSFMTITFELLILVFVVWQITTYFYALKESSGLTGKYLLISFIVIMILGEAISWLFTTIFI